MKKIFEVKTWNSKTHIIINTMVLEVTSEWFRGFIKKAQLTSSKNGQYVTWNEIKK